MLVLSIKIFVFNVYLKQPISKLNADSRNKT